MPLRAVAALDDLAERMFVQMLEGWRNQQLARNLALSTINAREAEVRRFVAEAGEYPWRWSPHLVDEWLGDQRAVRHLRQSTIRSKAISCGCSSSTSSTPRTGGRRSAGTGSASTRPRYATTGTPRRTLQEAEGRAGLRAFTTDELQALFDCADELVVTTRQRAGRGG
ncbi:MAG TPA: hypothetical protein VK988_00210 [Acidimicrobiales bacterium]|nr:hypothetical protein [Acidimicrobiales bacterium]